MRPIFNTGMLMHLSRANLDEEILFAKITHQLGPEIRKMLVLCIFRNEDSTFSSGS